MNRGRASVDPRTAALGADAGSLPLPAGTVLQDRFVIRSVLGRGGFGVTYMADHTGLDRRVALKEHFPEQFAVREGLSVRATASGAQMFKWGLDRFLEEAKRLARFKHPSIVDVTDVFEANGTAYMALAYEEGETLGQWLDRLGRPPTQAELDRLLGPILDALEHVHGHGILHRDIAPDNIMLRRDGTPVLIDFGAARQAMAERSHSLTGIVKHGYSPPEQYTRSSTRHGPWSDFYALGATLYRALTGASPQEATDRQLGDTVQDLRGLAARGYRPGFLAAIMQALALLPGDRPQSVAQWRLALLSDGRSQVSARPAATARSASGAGTGSQGRATSSPRPAPSSKPGSQHQPPRQSSERPPSALIDPPPPSRTPWAMIGALVIVLAILSGGGWFAYTTYRTEEVRRLSEVRREIAVATTSEALDRIASREPRLAPDIAKRREELATIARSERLKLLREQIARESSTDNLDRIANEAPELRPEAERRKAELAAEAKAARLRLVRERIAVIDAPAELDRIAAEEPEVRVDVEARKLALVRAARERRLQALRERIPATSDDGELDRIAAEAPELAPAARTRKAELARVRSEQEAESRRHAEQVRLARVQALRERIAATSDLAELDRIGQEAPELASAVQARKRELDEARQRDPALAVVPGSGQSFRDCPTCPEMVVVPAGRFTMGSPASEPDRAVSEGPQREVTIALPFAVGKFEVTFEEWNACRADGGCTHNPEDQGWGRGIQPVINVSWDDAKRYVAWLSLKTGKTYRLLSEAEWEYAARAGTMTPFWWGSSITPAQANYNSNHVYTGGGTRGVFQKRALSVSSFAPNPWGLYNVHGNVREWVEDCWHASYSGAPSDGSAWISACSDGLGRVLRGGSWNNAPANLRSATRDFGTTDFRSFNHGFRIGRNLNAQSRTPQGATSPAPDDDARRRAEAERQRHAAQEVERQRQRQTEEEARKRAEEETAARKRAEEAARRPDPALAVTPGSGQSFRDCPTCPEMVVVPAGRFTMGSPTSEPERFSDEGPQREVTIVLPFAVGKFEVTFAEWDACRSEGGCTHNPSDEGWGRGKQPVINVSWDAAKEFSAWLSRKTGKTYRLLSEAEWEYAARAGTSTPFWWGRSITPVQANYDGNRVFKGGGAKGGFRRRTVPVDSFAANPWGLYNIHGNVWEWVEDCWHDSYNGASTYGGARTVSCTDASRRVLRGGSWDSLPDRLRAAARFGYSSVYQSEKNGFRIARTLDNLSGPPAGATSPTPNDDTRRRAEAERERLAALEAERQRRADEEARKRTEEEGTREQTSARQPPSSGFPIEMDGCAFKSANRGKKTVALVASDTPSARSAAIAVRRLAESNGFSIVVDVSLSDKAIDFSATLVKLRGASPGVVFVCATYAHAFLQQAQAIGLTR